MSKSTKMWSVMEVYYKYGEGTMYSFLTEDEFVTFLYNKLQDYSKDCTHIDIDSDSDDNDKNYTELEKSIKKVIRLGNKIINYEGGSGITAIHFLDFEKQYIKRYEEDYY